MDKMETVTLFLGGIAVGKFPLLRGIRGGPGLASVF